MTLVPASSHVAGAPGAPFKPTNGNDVTVLTDSTGAHDLIVGGDDTGGVELFSINGSNNVTVANGGTTVNGALVAQDNLTANGTAVAFPNAEVTAVDLSLSGLAGAVSATRYVGGTAAVAPTTGDFLLGDFVVSLNGSIWVCTVSGTPGTWVNLARQNQLTSAGIITSGALPTQQFVTTTAAQVSTTRDVEVHTPVTFNPGVATTATCKVDLSPDNTTYSTLVTWTVPVGVALDGTIQDVTCRVPAGWYLKLTVSATAVLGLSTYY